MSISVQVGNNTYVIPQAGDPAGWGTNVTNWIAAASDPEQVLQTVSDSFPLAVEVDFGSAHGIKLPYVKSQGTNPASTGVVRLANSQTIAWRNAANDADLTISYNSSNQFTVNGATVGTVSSVGITPPAQGITVTGSPITSSGNMTLGLANDLAAVEGLTSTGLAVRTATSTWTTRTITGTTNRLTVTNGDGISGDPTLDIASTYVGQTSITTLGTVATGTWNATTIGTTKGGTGLTSFTTGDILYASGTNTLAKLPIGTNGQVLTSNGSTVQWGSGGGPGTVTSVGLSVPTGLQVSGSPITNSGTLAVTYASGYQGFTSTESTKLGNITLASTFTTSGANALTLTTTGATNVTLPTSGTLATTSALPTLTGTANQISVGTGPNYTVGLTNDVTIVGLVTAPAFKASAEFPEFNFIATGQAANNKNWLFNVAGLKWSVTAYDDAGSTFANLISGTRSGATISVIDIGNIDDVPEVNMLGVVNQKTSGSSRFFVPVYVGGNVTVGDADYCLYFDLSGAATVTLPAAATCEGRILKFFNMAGAFAVTSASNNVYNKNWTLNNDILPATIGSWCELMAADDGNWYKIAAGTNP